VIGNHWVKPPAQMELIEIRRRLGYHARSGRYPPGRNTFREFRHRHLSGFRDERQQISFSSGRETSPTVFCGIGHDGISSTFWQSE